MISCLVNQEATLTEEVSKKNNGENFRNTRAWRSIIQQELIPNRKEKACLDSEGFEKSVSRSDVKIV